MNGGVYAEIYYDTAEIEFAFDQQDVAASKRRVDNYENIIKKHDSYYEYPFSANWLIGKAVPRYFYWFNEYEKDVKKHLSDWEIEDWADLYNRGG